MGMVSFALATESMGTLVLSILLVLANMWLIQSGRFRPLPRWLANVITLLALVYYAMNFLGARDAPLLVVGRFLVALQIIKLFEQRANRDYGQLLVLSLLLMVAGAISTASLLFGVLFIAYLFLSLYCCLLFHLKTEADAAAAVVTVASKHVPAYTFRCDERRLSVSMRRVTILVSLAATVVGIAVFMMFPRGAGTQLFRPLQFHPSQALTGFSDQVSFQQVARITQNRQVVAHVKVWENGRPIEGTRTLYLRGLTVDVYGGDKGVAGTGPWQWSRSAQPYRSLEAGANGVATVNRTAPVQETRLQVTLQPTGSTALFFTGRPLSVSANIPLSLKFGVYDLSLAMRDPIYSPIEYTAVCATNLDTNVDATSISQPGLERFEQGDGPDSATMRATSQIDPRITEFARRPEVSGSNDLGPLVQQRHGTGPQPVDAQIAHHIERYLQEHFTYTLDLTDTRLLRDKDPLVGFLYDFKKGHCEYFAGAMTLLCQSLGMDARMVIGFKSDEYSSVGGYYIVRQSDAHTWVEVKTADGWKSYDPTSSRSQEPHEAGLIEQIKHLYDYFQFKWSTSVIAYDSSARDSFLTQLDIKLVGSAATGSSWLNTIRQWLPLNVYALFSQALSLVVLAMLLILVAAISWFLAERWRLRKRARRIGLGNMPVPEQTRLARQLGFYDDLLSLLTRHGINQPPDMTPMEFGRSLSYLPTQAYIMVQRLTAVFYRIRFGGLVLRPDRLRRLNTVIGQLSEILSQGDSRVLPEKE